MAELEKRALTEEELEKTSGGISDVVKEIDRGGGDLKDLPGMNIKFGPGGINKKEYPDAPIGTDGWQRVYCSY